MIDLRRLIADLRRVNALNPTQLTSKMLAGYIAEYHFVANYKGTLIPRDLLYSTQMDKRITITVAPEHSDTQSSSEDDCENAPVTKSIKSSRPSTTVSLEPSETPTKKKK